MVLGTWGLSGPVPTAAGPGGYPGLRAAETDAVLDAAWAAGVRWIDTAGAYGAGEGLRRVADWERRRARRWRVVVKPGRPGGADGPRSELDPDGIRAELAGQPVHAPAAVLIKDPPEAAIRDGTVRRLLGTLRADGHRLVGVATHRLDLVAELGEPPPGGGVLQLEFNLLNRVTAVPAARLAAAAGWAVWGMQPLAYGFLGGRHGAGTTFAADDWRVRIPPAARAAFEAGARSLGSWLPPGARRHPLAEAALAWCLAHPALSRTVVGPRSAEQLGSLDGAWELATDPDFARLTALQPAV
ncbi:hypothetical protein L3i22_041750 [Actinoplanes sp. L3-i22]|nr:hypothetical protein L3i22_041750 [Actinoplanes sp. L3-i22]